MRTLKEIRERWDKGHPPNSEELDALTELAESILVGYPVIKEEEDIIIFCDMRVDLERIKEILDQLEA